MSEENDSRYTSQEYFTAESFQGCGPVIPVELKKFEREEKTSLYRKLLDCGVIIEGLERNFSMPEAFYLVGFEKQTVAVGPVEGEIGFCFKRIDGKAFYLHFRTEEEASLMRLSFCDFTDDSLRTLIFEPGLPNTPYLRKIFFDTQNHILELTVGDKPQDPKGRDALKFRSVVQLAGRVEKL